MSVRKEVVARLEFWRDIFTEGPGLQEESRTFFPLFTRVRGETVWKFGMGPKIRATKAPCQWDWGQT